jgi:hypothetical protein
LLGNSVKSGVVNNGFRKTQGWNGRMRISSFDGKVSKAEAMKWLREAGGLSMYRTLF